VSTSHFRVKLAIIRWHHETVKRPVHKYRDLEVSEVKLSVYQNYVISPMRSSNQFHCRVFALIETLDQTIRDATDTVLVLVYDL